MPPTKEESRMDDIREITTGLATAQRIQFIEDTRLEARDNLRAVIACYDRATAEGHKFPTIMMCAVEVARSSL